MRSSKGNMPLYWGNTSPDVKEHVPRKGWNNSPMSKERVPPRVRLASNLKVLIEMQGLTSTQIANAAKVDRKTVNNLLNERFDPRLTLVEKVANVFGLTTWQMLATDLELKPPDSKLVLQLLEHYSNSEDEGRKAIMQVAEIAAHKAAD